MAQDIHAGEGAMPYLFGKRWRRAELLEPGGGRCRSFRICGKEKARY
jgi:hypothetical protein